MPDQHKAFDPDRYPDPDSDFDRIKREIGGLGPIKGIGGSEWCWWHVAIGLAVLLAIVGVDYLAGR